MKAARIIVSVPRVGISESQVRFKVSPNFNAVVSVPRVGISESQAKLDKIINMLTLLFQSRESGLVSRKLALMTLSATMVLVSVPRVGISESQGQNLFYDGVLSSVSVPRVGISESQGSSLLPSRNSCNSRFQSRESGLVSRKASNLWSAWTCQSSVSVPRVGISESQAFIEQQGYKSDQVSVPRVGISESQVQSSVFSLHSMMFQSRESGLVSRKCRGHVFGFDKDVSTAQL